MSSREPLPPFGAPSREVSERMARIRGRDTKPELALRRELHRRGRRYFVNRVVPPSRRRADLIFPSAKVAVFVDGCFFHACPQHLRVPKSNVEYWTAKLERNAARDRATDAELQAAGWTVVRIWEHEPPSEAADVVEAALRGAPSAA